MPFVSSSIQNQKNFTIMELIRLVNKWKEVIDNQGKYIVD